MPSRSTEISSAISSTSFNLWEIYTIETPSCLSLRMMENRFCVSSSVREAVGSSMISTEKLVEIAFAISIS